MFPGSMNSVRRDRITPSAKHTLRLKTPRTLSASQFAVPLSPQTVWKGSPFSKLPKERSNFPDSKARFDTLEVIKRLTRSPSPSRNPPPAPISRERHRIELEKISRIFKSVDSGATRSNLSPSVYRLRHRKNTSVLRDKGKWHGIAGRVTISISHGTLSRGEFSRHRDMEIHVALFSEARHQGRKGGSKVKPFESGHFPSTTATESHRTSVGDCQPSMFLVKICCSMTESLLFN
ncbi:hypothetical protein DL98DRAFT_258774 [Cadophora sp. DSE1049]|nr:hypothetical protein DL98DRAFT_258774 [Cadophora sp. DSE1049]